MTYAMSEVKTNGARSLNRSDDDHIMVLVIQTKNDADSCECGQVCHVCLSPFDVSEHLCVSKELPEVDVKHVAAGLQHDVVVVAVTDSQDVGRHTAAGTRVDEVFHGLDTNNRLDRSGTSDR